MAKQSGLGDRLFVGAYDLSGDTGSLGSIRGGPAPLDVTGIDKFGFERIGGLRDGAIEWASWFNSTNAHLALRPLPTADVNVMYARGAAVGNPAAALIGKQLGYDPSRNADGSLSMGLTAQSNGTGLDWGRQLTAGRATQATATNGAGVDYGVSTAFGAVMYVHVFAVTGTPTIKVQESADNGGADAWADVAGLSHAPVGVGAVRVATAATATVERWLRVVTTGAFSALQFAVMVDKREAAVGA